MLLIEDNRSSKSRLIREMQGSTLEGAFHGFFSSNDPVLFIREMQGSTDATVVNKPLMPSMVLLCLIDLIEPQHSCRPFSGLRIIEGSLEVKLPTIWTDEKSR